MQYIQPILICLILSGLCEGAHAEAVYKAWFEVESENGHLLITPYCQSSQGGIVRYEFTATRSGRSGTSRSHQAGTLKLDSGEQLPLATLRLGVASDDVYTLLLQIFANDGTLVAESEISFPP